jgi:hypothetical protein
VTKPETFLSSKLPDYKVGVESTIQQLALQFCCSANSIRKACVAGLIGDKVDGAWVISQEDALWFRYHVVMAPVHATFSCLVELVTNEGPVRMHL